MQFQQVQTGTTQQCDSYSTVPVFGQVCTQYQQVQTGWQNGQCLNWQQVQTGWQNGQCTNWQTVPQYQQQCSLVTVVDPTSETGYRQVNQCQQVYIGDIQQCTQYQQLPVFGQQCTQYQQVPVFAQQCVQYQQQQTGTTQQCDSWSTVPVFQNQCVQTAQVQTGQTCVATDPNWVCPPQNITQDNLTPARYYRYEGSVPATDDDLALISNYRLVEVDRAGGNNFPVPVDPRTGAVRQTQRLCGGYDLHARRGNAELRQLVHLLPASPLCRDRGDLAGGRGPQGRPFRNPARLWAHQLFGPRARSVESLRRAPERDELP